MSSLINFKLCSNSIWVQPTAWVVKFCRMHSLCQRIINLELDMTWTLGYIGFVRLVKKFTKVSLDLGWSKPTRIKVNLHLCIKIEMFLCHHVLDHLATYEIMWFAGWVQFVGLEIYWWFFPCLVHKILGLVQLISLY